MHVADALETSSDAGWIVHLSIDHEAEVVEFQSLVVVALVVITISRAAVRRNHSSKTISWFQVLQRAQVIGQRLPVVVQRVEHFSHSRETLAAGVPFRDPEKRVARVLVEAQLVLQATDAGDRVRNLLCIAGRLEFF